jgi:hypothetical protein
MEKPRDQFNHRIPHRGHDGTAAEPATLPTVAEPPDWPRLIADPMTADTRRPSQRPGQRPTVTPRIADRPEVLPLNLPPAATPRRADGLRPAKGHRAAADRRPVAAPQPRSSSRPLLLKWLRRAPLVILILLGLGCAGLSWLAVQEILNPGVETHPVALAEKEQEQISSLFLLGGVAVGCISLSILLAQQLRRAPRR